MVIALVVDAPSLNARVVRTLVPDVVRISSSSPSRPSVVRRDDGVFKTPVFGEIILIRGRLLGEMTIQYVIPSGNIPCWLQTSRWLDVLT